MNLENLNSDLKFSENVKEIFGEKKNKFYIELTIEKLLKNQETKGFNRIVIKNTQFVF